MMKSVTARSGLAAAAALTVMAMAGNGMAAPLTSFSFSSIPGQPLVFSPLGSFVFGDENGGNDDFQIDNQIGGAGTLNALFGDIDGDFSFNDPMGSDTAVVTTTNGEISISDGTDVFTASINLVELMETSGFGNLQGFAIGGTILYSGATYSGSNSDLQTLATTADNGGLITFQTTQVADLDDLYVNGATVSYSGTSSVQVPVPGTLALLGAGLIGLGIIRRRAQ